jgi:1-phosphofructokinase family hexose kinase
MIMTVTLNPAVDVTYRVPTLRPGDVHRITGVERRPGGKGVNVARVLHALGVEVVATGLSGGPTGAWLEAELDRYGVTSSFVPALPEVRTTVTVHADDGTTTSLWEPGHPPADPAGAANALLERCRRLAAGASALVVSGSLPPGVDQVLPARLVAVAERAGIPAIVDVDGEPLRLAVQAGHAVLMPNRDELARLDGAPVGGIDEVLAATGRLCERGAQAVIATLGADGLLARTPLGVWLARPPAPVPGNPTGAGDAAAAAVAAALSATADPARPDWALIVREAVALSASAVCRPVAGEVDLPSYRAWRDLVTVERLEPQ